MSSRPWEEIPSPPSYESTLELTVGPITAEDLPALAMLLEELTGSRPYPERMESEFHWMEANPDYILLGAS